ncbi:MAG TPA: adenylate/guanylate cyclase domain-containing protein [Solirubrobacteraceae bacterium]|nr:adenylate/guanylate cyclase domain-containing protein [Solirubrobacteraceae bacterium]
MRCPECAADIPDGMRFCGACGSEIGLRCASCGTPAAVPDQRFCGTCGAALSAVLTPMLERRLVSVLFADLVAFTTFSEERDPEDVREVLGEYFVIARRVVSDYGGTVEKFIGDAVMAVWGAPVAREDDAERSVRAAIELTSAIAALSRRLEIPQLRIRAGVLTGEAAVELGRVQEGMVVGDAVNTAARIQSVADPGTVLVDDVTRLACERAIEFEPAGVHQLKGKSAPVRAWRAVRVLARVGGVGRAGAVEPPLVGRARELQTLKDAFERVLAPPAGVQLVSVIGEPGVGKSRLLWEFEKHVDGITAEIAWHRADASSFGGAVFGPLADMVRARAEIAADDAPPTQLDRVQTLLTDLFATDHAARDRVAGAVHRLLGLDDGQRLIEPGELFSGWRTLFAAVGQRMPVVMVFDDLHQSAQALLDFIAHLVDWAQFPLMIVAVSRPDERLDDFTPAERVQLAPLAPDEIDALLERTVRGAPDQLVSAVRSEGGGIPLYAVETLRALADREILAVEDTHYVVRGELDDLAVAPTVRALVASRLDGLGTLERRVLTGGAVIGERFTASAAAAVAGVDMRDAAALLAALVTKAFLAADDEREPHARGRYAFLQGVVRRVTLNALSRRERKRVHLAAAAHIEHAEPEPERAGAVAGHLVAALEADPKGDDAGEIGARAQQALRTAAERSAAVGALADALALFDRAVELTPDERERAGVLERAGLVASRAGEAAAAAERYRASAELHAAAGRRREQLAARAHELRSVQYVRSPSELLPALQALDAALSDAEDRASALAAATLAFTLYQLGEPEQALTVARRGVRIAEACGDWGVLLHALGQQGHALAELQRPDEAIAVYRRALELAVVHEPRLVALLWDNVSISLASVGRFREAAAAAHEAIVAAERAAERLAERWARLALGRALCSLGEWDAAIGEIESVKDEIPTIQVGMALAPLVVIALARGDDRHARELVAEHDRRCGDGDASVFESDFRSLRRTVLARAPGELARIIPEAEIADFAEWTGWLSPVIDKLLAVGEPGALEQALAALRTGDAMKQTPPVRAQAERLAGHLAARAGDRHSATEALSRAARLARECELGFEAAVIAVERYEHGATDTDGSLARASATFRQLRAAPWVERVERLGNSPITPIAAPQPH